MLTALRLSAKSKGTRIVCNLRPLSVLRNSSPATANDVLDTQVPLNRADYASLIRQCITTRSLEMARTVHRHIKTHGFQPSIYMSNNIINMFVRCRRMDDARQVFDQIPAKNLVTWNAMIAGYSQCGKWENALDLFICMERKGFRSDSFTLVSVLRACGVSDSSELCKQIASVVLKSPFAFDLIVGNALIAVLVKSGDVDFARQVFERMPEVDHISWTSLIAGFAKEERAFRALDFFQRMQVAGFRPDFIALSSVLMACSRISDLERGKQLHGALLKQGLHLNSNVGTNLFRMYAKSYCLDEAKRIFDKLPERDLICWNAMIASYAENQCGEEAIHLFIEMQRLGLSANHFSYGSVLRACAAISSIEFGQQIHAQTVVRGLEEDAFVSCSLADMYVKSGSIEDADEVFEELNKDDVVSWNVMITGNAQHGYGRKALLLFDEMQNEGIKPNDITFVGVLSGCSHMGLTAEGRSYFQSMTEDYGIRPRIEHYACMVDLLGRSGHLQEAKDMIDGMGFEPNGVILRCLLSACRIHGDMKLAREVAERLSELEPWDDSTHVLLSNIYASAGQWEQVQSVRNRMRDSGITKEPGYSWIEVNHRMNRFFVGDRSHSQSEEIYAKLEELSVKMMEAGYVPDTNCVLHDVESEQKGFSINCHSEKLALCYGLITLSPGKIIRIFKNLRICGDCHTVMKLVSRIENRYVIVRDKYRFHHFKDGSCSCQDYW